MALHGLCLSSGGVLATANRQRACQLQSASSLVRRVEGLDIHRKSAANNGGLVL